VVLPAGPEIVHCDAEAVREASALSVPQASAFVAVLLAGWPCAGNAALVISTSNPTLFIFSTATR
jgi:hypothetical protein